jgi:branched-chain amino acid transport system substrate-binding protein
MSSSVRRAGSRLACALLTLALAAALAACGSSSSSSDGGEHTTAHRTAGQHPATGSPIRVGVIANQTGPGSNGEDDAPKVIQAWADAVNGDRGIAGHRVDVVVADTKGDPTAATAAVQRLLSDKRLAALVLFDAETENVYASAIGRSRLPVVGGMGYTPTAWGKLPNWLSLTTSFPAVIDMSMVMAKRLGSHTTTFAICAEYPTCAATVPLAQGATQKLGMAYAGTIKAAASAPDYTAQCLQMKSRHVDYAAVSLGSVAADMRFVSDCKTQGYAGKWGIFDGSVWPRQMIGNDPGVTMSVGLTAFPWFADAAPVKAYRDLMAQQGVPESVWADPHSTAAYATMELFRKALGASSAARQPTARDVVAAYGKLKGETLGGLLPQPVAFTPDKPEPPTSCYWIATFSGGTFTDGDLAKPVCDPAVLTQG